jgi:hypothetical protein
MKPARRTLLKPDSPGECKVVEGPISPKGWCAAYVKKA